jgi:hypothetical protein
LKNCEAPVAAFDSIYRESWFQCAARKLRGKAALRVYVWVAAIVFGDTVLSIVGAILHYLIEVLEMLLEHALESAFGLSGHTAQMATAWIGFSILSVLAVFLLRRAVRTVRKHAVAMKGYFSKIEEEFNAYRIAGYWPKSITYACLVLAVFYLCFL